MKRKTCFEKHLSKIAPSRTNENHESREKDYIVAHRMKNERKVSIVTAEQNGETANKEITQ